jgi:S-methylmethionine-dependent homocysteine/selenocysteine methylase
LNLVRPELVLDLHSEYIAAGARMIETNTFGANHAKLKAIGLEKKLREINRQGAVLARRAAAGKDVFVAGSVGPLIRVKGEEEELTAAEMADIYREQVLALAEVGSICLSGAFPTSARSDGRWQRRDSLSLPAWPSWRRDTLRGLAVERVAIQAAAALTSWGVAVPAPWKCRGT